MAAPSDWCMTSVTSAGTTTNASRGPGTVPALRRNRHGTITRTVRGLSPVPGPAGRYRSAMPPSRLRLSARGVLFVVLALGLLGIAVAAATAREWAVAVAAAVLAAWMADLALRDLGVRRRRA